MSCDLLFIARGQSGHRRGAFPNQDHSLKRMHGSRITYGTKSSANIKAARAAIIVCFTVLATSWSNFLRSDDFRSLNPPENIII